MSVHGILLAQMPTRGMNKDMEFIIPVVLAGGKGSRLWPLSRSSCPKQLLNLFGDNTLLQETLLRCNKISSVAPIIIYNEEYHFQILEQTKKINIHSATFIVEPVAKNTAPAIALAALEVQRQYGDGYLFVMPADHYMHFRSDDDLSDKLATARLLAKDYLVTFGVTPSTSESGYGYIQTGNALYDNKAFSIKAFIEKPSPEKAEIYSNSRDFFWNSGIFFLRANLYLAELQKYAPEVFAICSESYAKTKHRDGLLRVDSVFVNSPSISIDYAVMEHTKAAAVIPLNATWSDIGSWSSLFDLQSKNADGNVINGDVITESSKNCYIHSSHRLVATVGLVNHIIVETKDSVLVAHKDKSQEIKKIVERLAENHRVEVASHYRVARPWGYYEILIDVPNYKVKKLTVNIGCSLSLQKHKYRSEHWVVVKGIATIINGDNHFVLYPSQSTYIPKETKHRLSNFSDQPLEIVEVQIGEYLGEDDIERLDDLYGRNEKIKTVTN